MKTQIRHAQRAAGIAACIAAFLAIGKFGLYFLSGSLIIALSAWDSSIDVLISSINRMIIKFARKSSDQNHPYGHGKAESITALGQGALITGGALTIFGSSFQNMYQLYLGHTESKNESWITIVFFIIAGGLSYGVTYWLKYFGTRYNSPALTADAIHYRGDMISNFGSALSLAAIMWTHSPWIDPIIAGTFALYICWNGLCLMRTSINELMDHEVPENIKKNALTLIADCNPNILDIHNFRSRTSGACYFFDFHVTLPKDMPFVEVHAIIKNIEERFYSEYRTRPVVRADPMIATEEEEERITVFSRQP